MKKILTLIILSLVLSLTGCQSSSGNKEDNVYNIGICNYVDDASLNQIIENIEARLKELATENSVTFNVKVDNCNLDANVLNQIIANFADMDLMVGVATPVAIAMKNSTDDSNIPVVFAAVSDPLSAGLVDSLQNPGGNLTGTSDYLDTNAVINLIFAMDPEIDKVGLLYDVGQDSSTTAIAQAKELLAERNVEVIEKTGTNVSEIILAAQALVDAGCKAVFTPSDNTVMTAELSIYEIFANAGVLHYAGADSFALNGAFLGYGVDYANLGRKTADMIFDVLVGKKDISSYPVRTFDNGTATVNTDICELLGLDYEQVKTTIAPFCSHVQPIETAESFN